MNDQLQAIYAEFGKLKHHRITWITFIAFSLAPIMGAVFMLILTNPHMSSPALSLKAELMSFSSGWGSYLRILSQAMGVGGILIFGFVASWIFGREYSDRTAKDLLALPISRVKILNAKFVCYIVWCLALAVSNLIVGFILGSLLGLDYDNAGHLKASLKLYLITTLLTIPLGSVVSFLAMAGKGYLAPLGLVAITLVLAQIIAAAGFGFYFPWSIPGLYSGTGGPFQPKLNGNSYLILALTCAAGYVASVLWWKYADQTK